MAAWRTAAARLVSSSSNPAPLAQKQPQLQAFSRRLGEPQAASSVAPTGPGSHGQAQAQAHLARHFLAAGQLSPAQLSALQELPPHSGGMGSTLVASAGGLLPPGALLDARPDGGAACAFRAPVGWAQPAEPRPHAKASPFKASARLQPGQELFESLFREVQRARQREQQQLLLSQQQQQEQLPDGSRTPSVSSEGAAGQARPSPFALPQPEHEPALAEAKVQLQPPQPQPQQPLLGANWQMTDWQAAAGAAAAAATASAVHDPPQAPAELQLPPQQLQRPQVALAPPPAPRRRGAARGAAGRSAGATAASAANCDGGVRKKKIHSSVRMRQKLSGLQAGYEAVLQQYEAEAALNQQLQQRWQLASATFDIGLAERLRLEAQLQPSRPPPPPGCRAGSARAELPPVIEAAGAGLRPGMAHLMPYLRHMTSAQQGAMATLTQASWSSLVDKLAGLLPQLESELESHHPLKQPRLPLIAIKEEVQHEPALDDALPALLPSPFAAAAAARGATDSPCAESPGGTASPGAARAGAPKRLRRSAAARSDSAGSSDPIDSELVAMLSHGLSLDAPLAKHIKAGSPGLSPAASPAAAAADSDATVRVLSVDTALACSTAIGLFQNLLSIEGQAATMGPLMLLRMFGPRPAACACCAPRRVGNGGAATGAEAGAAGCASSSALDMHASAAAFIAQLGAGAAGEPAGAPSAPAGVHASPAHWHGVLERLQLLPQQADDLAQLWQEVAAAHAANHERRAAAAAALAAHADGGGAESAACYATSFAGQLAHETYQAKLEDVAASLEDDLSTLASAGRRLWGEQSMLSFVQKLRCLVYSQPFWPDYGLLQQVPAAGQL